MDAWRTQLSCSAGRHATLIFHFHADWEPAPELLDQSPRLSGGPLRSNQRNQRHVDKLQILSCNPERARGSDSSLLATLLNGPWYVICVQVGSGFVIDSSLAENFHSRILLPAASRPRRSGPSRAWVSLECAAGRPTHLAPTSRSRTFTSTKSAPRGGPFVSCSFALVHKSCAVIVTGDFNRKPNVNSFRALPPTSVGSPCLRPPSATPMSCGLPLVLTHCGAPDGKPPRVTWT